MNEPQLQHLLEMLPGTTGLSPGPITASHHNAVITSSPCPLGDILVLRGQDPGLVQSALQSY